jgi:hypothetical protein
MFAFAWLAGLAMFTRHYMVLIAVVCQVRKSMDIKRLWHSRIARTWRLRVTAILVTALKRLEAVT